jgi:flagellar basal body-associated protein FliL
MDRPTPKSRTARVVLIMLIVLGVLVAGGLVAAFFFQDAVTNLFNGILGTGK